MSESSTLTRCPHCETRFRVTGEQLGVAKGKVRCGHCLQVFNANEHRELSAEKNRPQSSPPPVEPSGPLSDEDVIFEDDPDEDAASGNYAGGQTGFSEDELSDSFLAFDNNTGNSFNEATDDEPEESVDESWAEAILANSKPDTTKSSASNRITPDHDDAILERHHDQPETDAPEPPPEPQEEQASDSLNAPSRSEPNDTFVPDDVSDGASASVSAGFTAGEGPGTEQSPETGDETGSPYDNLRVDPISTRYANNTGSNGGLRRIIWGVVLFALIGILIAQVTYFQVDRLSSIPELRPYYEQGCQLIGCELPPLEAVDQIDSQKLVVRTHPEQRNMLVVDAVIVNRAAFAQPFPNIGLTFSNLNEDVVAQSLFEPDEYLAGDARKLDAMPSDKSFRISITIRDPGRDAVNYNIAFIARNQEPAR